MEFKTRYTRSSGDVHIAYQVVGDAPRDLVIAPGWIFHLEVVWEQPSFEAFMRRLTRSFRVILFDKRGTGLSDRGLGASSMEERMDDLRAVMDAAGAERAAVMGWSEGGNIAAMFAATFPERVNALILYGAAARYTWAPDYPFGVTEQFVSVAREMFENQWGMGLIAYAVAPTRAGDEAVRRWFGRLERMSVSPGQALEMMAVNLQIDTTALLAHLRVPTLILHNAIDAFVPVEASRYIAQQIPSAKLVELPGDDHLFWFSNSDDVVGEIEDFLLGARTDHASERVLSTVMFTDIVRSTERAAELGDGRWRECLDVHDRLARETVSYFRGNFIKSTGDGVFATFDGPARAVMCAARLRTALRQAGLPIRAGVHTGEVELRGEDVGGLGVHIGARIAALAEPEEVWTSSTVRDLSAGAGMTFDDRGVHRLQGIAEPWRLYAANV